MGKNDREHLDKQAATLITLGNLLKRRRSAADQAKIEEIIALDISNQEKIDKIEALDRETRRKPHSEEPRKVNRFGSDGKIQEKTRAEKKREKIKNKLFPTPFLRYLFRERRKIKEYGEKTGILKGMRIKRDIRHFFISFYQPLLSDCLNLLNQLTGNSWLYLTKKEYNLIVLFRDFCKQLIGGRFTNLQYKDRNCIDQFSQSEKIFLSLHYREEFLEGILLSVEKLIEQNRRNISNLDSLPKLIRTVLSRGGEAYSFYNVILVLNMVKYRRFLTIQDLIRSDLGEIVDTSVFICSEQTTQEIDRFVRETTERLKMLNMEKIEIGRLKDFIHTDGDGQLVLDRLQFFYDSVLPSKEHAFSGDKDNIIPFTKHFLYLFSSAFSDMLNATVILSELGPVRLFRENYFKEKMTKLMILEKKIGALEFKLPSFTRSRYLQIKNQNRGAIQIEAEVITLVDESIEHLLDIGKLMERLMRSENENPPLGPGEFEPVEISQIGKVLIVFPFANRIREPSHPFFEKTLLEMLSDLVASVYTFASYLQDLTLLHMLGKEHSVESEILTRLEKLERIATAEQYNEVKALF